MTVAAAPLLSIENVTTRFRAGSGGFGRRAPVIHALEDVSFTVGKGEIVGVVGESGSGKSTLGRTLLRLDRATSGRAFFNGRDVLAADFPGLAAYRRQVQAIFQDPVTSLNPRMKVGDIVAEPLVIHRIGSRAEREAGVARLLARVGLAADAMGRYPREFSGGQRQRIGIARAIAVTPELIIADEPVSALDVSVQAQVINLLLDLRGELGLSLLFISHDLPTVAFLCDKVVVMYLGHVVEIAPADFQSATIHPYSRMLVENAPRFASDLPKAATAVDMPSPLTPPSGCVFRTRCPIAVADCAGIVPPLQAVAPGHTVACIVKGRRP